MTGSILSRSTLSSSLSTTQSQVDGLVGGFAEQATDWRSLAAMMAGGMAYRAGRVGIMGLGSGNALRVASVGLGLTAEVATFEGTHRGLTALSGEARSNPNLFRWNGNGGLRQGFLNSFVTFGALKGAGRLAQGENVLIQHLLQDSGMVLGHHATGAMGLAPRPTGSLAEQFLHAEATNLQLGAGMALAGRFAPGLPALERGLDLSLQLGSETAAPSGRETSSLALATAGGSGIVPPPAPRENHVRGPQILQMSSNEKGEGSTGPGPAAEEGSGFSSVPPETAPAVPHLITVRSRETGDSPRKIDPEQTLAMLPMGSLTPHGDEVSTYQRAVGHPEWIARVGVLNGHLKYLGDGQYAAARNESELGVQEGQPLSLDQISTLYGDRIRSESGIRLLETTLPIETPWAGQIPVGIRGPEGKIPERIFEVMGVGKKDFQYIRGNAQFAAQGLYALARSAMQWGLRLDDIVGHDPRRLAISTSAGLGGMENLIVLIAQSMRRKESNGNPTTKTDPPTGPLVLPGLLIDAMQGLFTSVLGPKGDDLPPGLTPESIIRTVGRIPVDVGACATGYKAFSDAADLFRPTWPGQTPTELAIFGSSEAAHGLPHARSEATGFNAMGAMDTTERLANRLGLPKDRVQEALQHLQGSYAPLSSFAPPLMGGFWPSEGAGVGGLMRLNRAIELGLPFDALVAGYSISGDQGGKSHPGNLGLGGATSLLESLNMALAWQGLDPRRLDYMNLHGTGTRDNNQVEPSNLLRVLEAFDYQGPLKLSAFKALLGHGLGAAGSMEMALLMLSARNRLAPGAFNLDGKSLDENVLALGARILVNSDPMSDPQFFGGASQGFAGNNGTSLFRSVNDGILHEIYGYTIAQIDAYRSRESERRGQAREWDEDIRTGRKTMADFLKWFALGSEPTPRRTFVDLAPARSGETEGRPTEAPPQTMPASPRALDLPAAEPSSSAVPPVLDPKAAGLAGTLDLVNSLWKAPEAEARDLFIEMDRLSGALNPEENHILATVLKVGLGHEEPRRSVVALTGLTTVIGRIDPARRLELAEQILPLLSNPDSQVRGAAANALVHSGLALTPAELARVDLGLIDNVLSKEDPTGHSEALLVLCSHYPLLPPSERPFAARHILEGFHRQDRLASPHLVLRKILQDLPEEDRRDFAIFLTHFEEERDNLLQTYSQVLSEITSKTPTLVPEPDPFTRGPEIMTRTIFPLSPDQVVVTLGEGAGITPEGSMRTTRRVAMGEPDAIAHKAEDAGLVRYAGMENGETQWRDVENGNPISLYEIEERYGADLRRNSGVRDLERLPVNDRTRSLAIELLSELIPQLPEGSERRNLFVGELEKLQKHPIDSMVADFGGVVPSYMRNSLYERMGMTFSEIGKTRIGGAHYKNVLSSASDQTRLYLWGATEVLNQLGGTLPDLYPHSRRVGFAFGAAFEGWDALLKVVDTHRRGAGFSGLNTPLPDSLISHAPAVLANMLGPQFNYAMLKRNPGALRGIVPPDMDPLVGPNTMGPVYTEVAACASAFYALAAGANALTGRLPGQWRPELFLLGASDASLSPLANPFLVTGFSDVAPISRARLRELGLTPAQASMPLSRNASGLVISEAAGAIGMTTLSQAVARRQMISAIVAGWGLSLGEGGKEMLMGMDEGSVGAILEAVNMGIAGHGLSANDVKVVQLHGTSTALNNLAEMVSLYKVFGAYGGERARPILNALKGLIGHSMGAASMIDLLNAVATLREQRAPRLFNFSMDLIDERFANPAKTHLPEDITPAFRFPTESVNESIEAVLGITEGFGSRNAAVLLRRFDPTILRHYAWPSEMKGQVEDFIAAWPDIVAQYEADQLELRSGRRTRGQLVLNNAYPNPVLK